MNREKSFKISVQIEDKSGLNGFLLQNDIRKLPQKEKTEKKAEHSDKNVKVLYSELDDTIIFDLSDLDEFGDDLVERLKNRNNSKLNVIALSEPVDEEMIQRARDVGVKYYRTQPVASESKSTATVTDKTLDRRISDVLHEVGVPAHIKGYPFLREAIKMTVLSKDSISGVSKVVYPHIAEQFNTSAAGVERAIHHAIEVAWNRGNLKQGHDLFGFDVFHDQLKKPTNGEFVALLSDFFRMEKEWKGSW